MDKLNNLESQSKDGNENIAKVAITFANESHGNHKNTCRLLATKKMLVNCTDKNIEQNFIDRTFDCIVEGYK